MRHLLRDLEHLLAVGDGQVGIERRRTGRGPSRPPGNPGTWSRRRRRSRASWRRRSRSRSWPNRPTLAAKPDGPERGRIELQPQARLRSGRQRIRPQACGAPVGCVQAGLAKQRLGADAELQRRLGRRIARFLGGLRSPRSRRPSWGAPWAATALSDAGALVRSAGGDAGFFFGFVIRAARFFRLVARIAARGRALARRRRRPRRPRRRRAPPWRPEPAAAPALLRLRQRHPPCVASGRADATAGASSARPADASPSSAASATATPIPRQQTLHRITTTDTMVLLNRHTR